MACDASSRYQQLLQPIRDLSKVWNIAIAEELEKYIEEVSSLSFEAEEDCRQLNFAEAALLIQGSAAVYSRKVELLYALVYQALTTCQQHAEKEESAGGPVRKKLHTGLWAPIPETEELLTIDHLIKEGRNITIDDSARRQDQRQFSHLRLPLFLLPREKTEGKQEFRIGNCSVHSSGAYLLQESDAHLLDEFIGADAPTECSRTPLVPPPPKEVHDLDERLQRLLRGLQDPAEISQTPLQVDETICALDLVETPAPALAETDFSSQPLVPLGDQVSGDPWELLDEHAQLKEEASLEVDNCTKRYPKRLLAKADVLPRRGSFEPLVDEDFWRPGHAMDGLPELLATAHPIDSVFLAVARILRHGNKTEAHRAGFSAAWLEFNDLFEAIRKRGSKGRIGKGNGESALDAPCDEHFDDDADTPQRHHLEMDEPDFDDFGEPILEHDQNQQRRIEVAKIEGLIEDAQTQYETTIRNQLHQLHGNEHVMNEKYPELYENVRRWQQQLKPVLKEFESHPEFNIDGYREKVLGKMVAVEKAQADHELEESSSIPFSRLVYGKPSWEVCRRFLTCLILTNQGSTDIVPESDEHTINCFSVKLLKEERHGAELGREQSASDLRRAPKRLKVRHSVDVD